MSLQDEAENVEIARNWERHAAGDWGKTVPLRPDSALRYELGLWRRVRPPVFDHLVANNEHAATIARRAGWLPLLRLVAAPIPPEVRRGPPLDDDEP